MVYFDLCKFELILIWKIVFIFDCICLESCGIDGYCCFIIIDFYSFIRGVVVVVICVIGREVGYVVIFIYWVVLFYVIVVVWDIYVC